MHLAAVPVTVRQVSAHKAERRMDADFPAAMDALRRLSQESQDAALGAGLDQRLIELIRIRVSQMNGCAYCLRLHSRDALRVGESPDRLAVLSAWRETNYFTDIEEAALELAEATTSLGSSTPDPGVLSDAQYAAVRWVAVVMNAFNRVAVTSGYIVAP